MSSRSEIRTDITLRLVRSLRPDKALQLPSAGGAVSVLASHAGKWGNIPILFRHTLHQLNDHRKQMIPGLNSHSSASDIANHDVEPSSRRPDIDRRHGT